MFGFVLKAEVFCRLGPILAMPLALWKVGTEPLLFPLSPALP